MQKQEKEILTYKVSHTVFVEALTRLADVKIPFSLKEAIGRGTGEEPKSTDQFGICLQVSLSFDFNAVQIIQIKLKMFTCHLKKLLSISA